MLDSSSQRDTLPLSLGSQRTDQESGGVGNAVVSKRIGFGPHMKGTPYVFPFTLTKGESRSFAESFEYSGNLERSRGSARLERTIMAATSLEGEMTS